jgi:hypothetical protein
MPKTALLLFLSICLVPQLVFAAGIAPELKGEILEGTAKTIGDTVGQTGELNVIDIRTVIAKIANALLLFLGVLFVAFLIYAGYLYMTAGGDTEKIEKALRIIKATVIGVVIVIVSYSITYFVFSELIGAEYPQQRRAIFNLKERLWPAEN